MNMNRVITKLHERENMNIGKKILVGYALMLLLMLFAVVTGFYGIRTIHSTYNRFTTVEAELVNGADDLRFEVRDQTANLRGLLLFPEQEQHFLDKLQADYNQFDTTIEKMQNLVITDEGLQMVNNLAELQSKYKQEHAEIIALIKLSENFPVIEAIYIGLVLNQTKKVVMKYSLYFHTSVC